MLSTRNSALSLQQRKANNFLHQKKIRADYQCDSQPFSLPDSNASPVAELHQKGIDKIAYSGGIIDNIVRHY